MAGTGAISRAYLLLYNVAMFAGWAYALYELAKHASAKNTVEGSYAAAGDTIRLFQLVSGLEILHAALGLVGGSWGAALMQWAGRSNVLFGVVAAEPEVQGSLAVGIMCWAWALSEVIRYPWYAASLAGICPRWLTWLRYTAFIPLYPLGVVGEMWAVVLALPHIKQNGLHTISMPNAGNFAFDYSLFLKVLLCLYPFLWFRLYSFLFSQRRKKLQPTATAAGKKRQ
ncbi:Very-long-chain (3R)-3-hydroxyacyl-CoA dehydratase 2 [Chlorella vulgaris]